MTPGDRILVHGPSLRDLSDLLYFDAVAYPVTNALVRPRGLAPGYAGYPLREPLNEAVRARLREAGLIRSPGVLMTATGVGPPLAEVAASAATLGQIYFSTLETPATSEDVLRWKDGLDAKTTKLADLATAWGHRAVPKLYAEDVVRSLRPGWTSVLCVTITLPRLLLGPDSLEPTIALLCDGETRRLRAQLFDWHAGVPAAIECGDLRMDEVPSRISSRLDEYRTWIAASGLFGGTVTADLLLAFHEPFVRALSVVEAPAHARGSFRLGRRGVSLTNAPAHGRELAFVSHSNRNFRELLPG